MRYVEKYGTARQATDTQNMYFTIATMVTRMDLDVVFIPTLPILFFSLWLNKVMATSATEKMRKKGRMEKEVRYNRQVTDLS